MAEKCENCGADMTMIVASTDGENVQQREQSSGHAPDGLDCERIQELTRQNATLRERLATARRDALQEARAVAEGAMDYCLRTHLRVAWVVVQDVRDKIVYKAECKPAEDADGPISVGGLYHELKEKSDASGA